MLQLRVKQIGNSTRTSVLAALAVELFDEVNTITIHDVRILKNRGGIYWVSLPTFSTNKDGAVFYGPTVQLNHELQARLAELCLAAFHTCEAERAAGAVKS
jgi:DNA-binding cell septation regulator SpoVG